MIDVSKIKEFNKEVYTIGYRNLAIADFMKVIKDYGIDVIIDVRSVPYSRYYKDYNADTLKNKLKPECIYYRNYKDEFGARQFNSSFYGDDGILDFKLFTASEQFKGGVTKLNNALKLKHTVCLMCSESDALDCHRTIMVGKYLYDNGYKVNNIHISTGTKSYIETQDIINGRLLNKYAKELNGLTDKVALETAYIRRNKDIGYKMN
ncbi:MAG: DUF488 domain-containing protein [Clostridia bacterium]|nr:DUF488 domain-containing protein [Clostridia bacterium]